MSKCPKCGYAWVEDADHSGYECGALPEQQGEVCRIRELEAEIERLKKELVEKRAEIEILRTEIDGITEAHIAVMSEQCPSDEVHCTCVPVLRDEIKNVTAMRDDLANEVERLNANLAAVVTERDRADSEIDSFKYDVERLRCELADRNALIRNGHAEIERLRAWRDQIQEDKDVADLVIEEQATELGRLRDVVIQDGEEKDGMIRRLVNHIEQVHKHGLSWADPDMTTLDEAREMIGDKRPKGDN